MRKKALSIQSHVVRDYVGNKAAVFPLQRMGYTVDFINSVEFSSMFVHNGTILKGNDMENILNGLLIAFINPRGGGFPGAKPINMKEVFGENYSLEKAASFIGGNYSHILTGYITDSEVLKKSVSFISGLKNAACNTRETSDGKIIGEASFSITEIAESCKHKKKVNPFWVCDPVLGDNGVFYVSREVVDIYINYALPVTDLITPNQFEAEILADIKLDSFKNVQLCCDELHKKGPNMVVITSVFFPFDPNFLYLICSHNQSQSIAGQSAGNGTTYTLDSNNNKVEIPTNNDHNSPINRDHPPNSNLDIYYIRFPKKQVYLGGTGDLFTSLLASQILDKDLSSACEKSLSIIQEIISYTMKSDEDCVSVDVIGSQHLFENCPVSFKAESFLNLV